MISTKDYNALHKIYKERLYKLIHFDLLKDRVVLDIGCGDGEDAYNLSKIAKKVAAIDVEEFKTWKKYKSSNLSFSVGDAQIIPYKADSFNGIFLKDVLHHVVNPAQVLHEIERVTKKGSVIILVEGNRYNPLFYIHMTKMLGHEHLSRKQFQQLIKKKFKNVKFYQFESHFFPSQNPLINNSLRLFTWSMENIPLLNKLLSYNVAVIQK